MLFARTPQDIASARRNIARIGKLSDNIVGFGPFGIGIDGILAWIPGVGDFYSVAAGGLLLWLGVRTRAPLSTLIQVGVLVGLRSVVGAAALSPLYPISGAVVDLFRGHKMSADLLVKAIDKTIYVAGPRRDIHADPDLAEARATGARIVFLG